MSSELLYRQVTVSKKCLTASMARLRNYKKKLVNIFAMLVLVNISLFIYVYRPLQFLEDETFTCTLNFEKNIAMKLRANETKEFDFVIFTTFVPLEKRYVVYNNTKRNWPSLSNNSKTVLFTNLTNLAEEFLDAGWDVLSEFNISSHGTPTITSMYKVISKRYKAPIIGYANADILFTDKLTKTLLALQKVLSGFECHVIATGRRNNVQNVTMEEARTFESLNNRALTRVTLDRYDAEDYFFTDSKYPWHILPDLLIGRIAYDNFLLAHARAQHFITFDFSNTVDAIHQTVDDGHLEKWKPIKEHKYNKVLINKRFVGVNYYAGRTDCLSHKTVWRTGNISIEKRNRKTMSLKCSIRMYDLCEKIND